MVTWRWTGYNALIYLAAMQAVPDELYEAASVDGASGWRQFFHITIPIAAADDHLHGHHLDDRRSPALHRAVPLPADEAGGTGGSDRQYQTVAMYLYEKAFGGSEFKFGYASAIAWSLFLLIAAISLVNYLIIRRIRSAD